MRWGKQAVFVGEDEVVEKDGEDIAALDDEEQADVSLESAGRQTLMLGMLRSDSKVSTG